MSWIKIKEEGPLDSDGKLKTELKLRPFQGRLTKRMIDHSSSILVGPYIFVFGSKFETPAGLCVGKLDTQRMTWNSNWFVKKVWRDLRYPQTFLREDKLYAIFYANLFVLDLTMRTAEEKELKAHFNMHGGTCDYIEKTSDIVGYGGSLWNSKATVGARFLDSDSLQGKTPFIKGTIPEPRKHHCSLATDSRVFYYGGVSANPAWNDLDVLVAVSSMTYKWERIACKNEVLGRSRMAGMVKIGSRILILGGIRGDDYENYCGDAHVMDLEENKLYVIPDVLRRPQSLMCPSMHMCGDRLYLIGDGMGGFWTITSIDSF